MLSFLRKNFFILFVLAAVMVLRIPSLFEPYWYGDEGIYLTLGMGIKKGLLLYRDIFDNKPPLIYLLTALADGKLYWFRSMLFISSLISTYFFYLLSKKIIDSNKATKISVLVFALFTTIRLLEGNIANAENFVLLPAVLGYLLAVKANRSRNYLFPGLLFSAAFLLKVPALFDFAGLLVFLLFFKEKRVKVKELALLVSGFLLPIALVSLYFLLKGAFEVYFNSVFLQTAGYLSSWETGSHAFNPILLLKSDFSIRSFILLFSLGGLWIFRKKLKEDLTLASSWFLFSLFAASLSGRPYPHYLIQSVPSFALCVGIFFKRINKKEIVGKIVPLFLFLLLTLVLWRYKFWIYKTVPYYKNFIEFSIGKIDKTVYFNFFNPRMSDVYILSGFAKANTLPSEKIFIWADEPYVYALSQRLPATRYTVAYHIKDLKATNFVIAKLQDDKISLIIKDKKTEEFPELEIILKNKYRIIENIGDFIVYRRKG